MFGKEPPTLFSFQLISSELSSSQTSKSMSPPPTSNSPTPLSKSPFPPLPTHPVISPQPFWEKFTDDVHTDPDALPLSDAFQDFEFRTSDSGLLLHADDIFHHGRLLRVANGGSAGNSNCSSASMSRSQSSSSDHSANSPLPRLSVSNRFYAHPSPKPQVRSNLVSGRKSTGSVPVGWGLFRVGVAKAPEIELNNLRSRLARSGEKKCGEAKEKPLSRFGFGCKCEPDVSEPVMIAAAKKEKKGDGIETKRKSSRVFEWLEEVSMVNGSNIGLKFV